MLSYLHKATQPGSGRARVNPGSLHQSPNPSMIPSPHCETPSEHHSLSGTQFPHLHNERIGLADL